MFDAWLSCSDPHLETIAGDLILNWGRAVERDRQRRLRPADRQNRDDIVRAILANLAFAAAMGAPAIGVSLRAAKQRTSRYERLGFRRLPEILELLAAYGILRLERSTTKRVASTVRAAGSFADDLHRSRISKRDFGQILGRETVFLSRVERDFAGREEGRELIEYRETPETGRFRAEVGIINAFLGDADIRLEDAQGQSVQCGLPFLCRHFSLPPDAAEGTERFDLGGRLFGWWQNLPKVQRRGIRIRGEAVADLDFANMALRLAYLEAGHPPPEGDLYAAIPGLSEPRWRPGVKKAVLAMLFRNSPLTRVPRGTRGELPPDLSGPQLRGAILAGHPVLAGIFETGIGLRLMFIESQILVSALLTLADKRIPAIPMHDGLMVAQSKAHQATTVMSEAAERITGHRLPILLKSLY